MRGHLPAKAGQHGGPWCRQGYVLIDERFDHAVSLVPKGQTWSRLLFFLHGYGDSAVWALRESALFDKLRSRGVDPSELKLMFPFAPQRWGKRSWFDYHTDLGPEEEDEVDEAQVAEERRRLTKLLDHEVEKLGGRPDRVFLAGHSQGAQMAWDLALTWPQQAGGLVSLSGFPMTCSLAAASNAGLVARRRLPIVAVHGETDQAVSADLAIEKFLPLADRGFHWELHLEGDLGHDVLGEERVAGYMCRFLRAHWSPADDAAAPSRTEPVDEGDARGPAAGESDKLAPCSRTVSA